MTARWPDPSATALDRARAIARSYRAELAKHAPQSAGILDDGARRVGEAWVCGVETGERLCTVADAALLLGVSERRVRTLVGEHRIEAAGKTTTGYVLLVQSVLDYQRERRGGEAGALRGSEVPSDASGRTVSSSKSQAG